MEDIRVRNIVMGNILRSLIFINTFYKAWAVTGEGKALVFCNLHVSDIRCNGAQTVVEPFDLEE